MIEARPRPTPLGPPKVVTDLACPDDCPLCEALYDLVASAVENRAKRGVDIETGRATLTVIEGTGIEGGQGGGDQGGAHPTTGRLLRGGDGGPIRPRRRLVAAADGDGPSDAGDAGVVALPGGLPGSEQGRRGRRGGTR